MKFDRHNSKSKNLLATLRAKGSSRLQDLGEKWERQSKALDIITPYLEWQGKNKGIFIDCGCGEAPETFIMARKGWKAVGLDLFDLDKEYVNIIQHPILAKDIYESPINFARNAIFIKQDICEDWNWYLIKPIDIIHCYAMITLLTREERKLFYQQAFKHLKEKGLFIIYFQKLGSGHDFVDMWNKNNNELSKENTIKHSLDLLKKIGFKILDYKLSWILVTK